MSFPGRSLLQAPHTEVLSLRGTTLTCLFDFEAMPLLTAFVGREANRWISLKLCFFGTYHETPISGAPSQEFICQLLFIHWLQMLQLLLSSFHD